MTDLCAFPAVLDRGLALILGRRARLEPLEELAMDELEGERYNTESEGARDDMPASPQVGSESKRLN